MFILVQYCLKTAIVVCLVFRATCSLLYLLPCTFYRCVQAVMLPVVTLWCDCGAFTLVYVSTTFYVRSINLVLDRDCNF